jgi:hypothetical protein
MKKILLLFSLVFFSYQAQSQILISLLFGDKLNSPDLEFGLEGGFSFAQIQGLDANERLGGLNLGLYFDIRVKNNFWVYTGLLLKNTQGVNGLSSEDLSLLGTNEYIVEGDYSQILSYFILPAFAKYKFESHIYLEAGPQFGYLREAHVKYTSEQENVSALLEEDNQSDLNSFDFGLTAGAGYTLLKGKGVSIGARYYYGLTDVYKEVSGTNNSHFYLKVNIPIGAAKKETPSAN